MESSSELSYRSKVLDYIGPTLAAVTWVRRSPIGRWSPSSEYRTPRRPLVLRRPLGGAGLNLRYSSCGDVALQRRRWPGGGGGFTVPSPNRCCRHAALSRWSGRYRPRVMGAGRSVGVRGIVRYQTRQNLMRCGGA